MSTHLKKIKSTQLTFQEQGVKDSVMTTLIEIHFYLAPEKDKGN